MAALSDSGGVAPAWKRRSVERSTAGARKRAADRAQRFMRAARIVMARNGTTEFTVQDVVDESGLSLRTLYVHFAGKHELLLAIYEDVLHQAAVEITREIGQETDALNRVRIAITRLFAFYEPDARADHVLLSEFAPRLLLSHPKEVRRAYAPLTGVFIECFKGLHEVGLLRKGLSPNRTAVLVMQTTMSLANGNEPVPDQPRVTADEVWKLSQNGFAAPRP